MRRLVIASSVLCCLALLTPNAASANTSKRRNAQQQKKASQGAKAARPRVEYLRNVGGTRQLPFSEAVRVGEVLYLSGQIGVGPEGALVSGGIEAETRRTLENIRATLERHGASMDDVFKCTVMLADIRTDYAPMNTVYRTFFKPERMPARSTFGTGGLVLGARVEIECWAAAGR